ncbi:unnamed protein product, partial [Porites lobata]
RTFGQGETGRPGVGFNLTSDGKYDTVNKKLANVAEGTASSDAITKHELDTAMIDKHDNNQNIDLKNTYNVINSKQQTCNEMNGSRNALVCYENIRDVFVSDTRFNMVNHKIINLGDPTSNKDATNKAYVDTNFLKLSGGDIT